MEALVSGVGHCRTKIGGWWWNRCGWASRCVGRSKSRLALRSSLFFSFSFFSAIRKGRRGDLFVQGIASIDRFDQCSGRRAMICVRDMVFSFRAVSTYIQSRQFIQSAVM